MNLTGHRGPEAVLEGLIVDAIALEGEVARLGEFAEIVDLGSGAGFPGIPFALLDARRCVHLVESRERRHHFQRAVKRRVNAANLDPIRGRLEVLEPRPCGLAICQALAAPRRAIALALPWTIPGGIIVVPGGEQPPDPGPDPEITAQATVRYRVPGRGPRSLWWGRRRVGDDPDGHPTT